MNYWLFKSEPETFSIDALRAMPNMTAHWDGVRNYQVRNMLRDLIKVGDHILFYHSNCKPPGIVGIAEVVKEGYPEPEYPWYMVDVKFVEKFKHMLTLDKLKHNPCLKGMQVIKKGNRLSITPVNKQEWDAILKMR